MIEKGAREKEPVYARLATTMNSDHERKVLSRISPSNYAATVCISRAAHFSLKVPSSFHTGSELSMASSQFECELCVHLQMLSKFRPST
ncbi:hypothetical protein Y032_0069g298 [Ancylostoma ceylanicum]|uniref:Uncharacterized protein n=1 Tax=Ancylostoma ceylanicum TaxID=53326 RepID=A0A016TXQ9_9BILA|nr:hypothetical protein Y032_0069g298 [Ancylostoma ceylanicum]